MSIFRRSKLNWTFLRSFAPALLETSKAAPHKQVDYSDRLAAHFKSRGDRPALLGESSSMSWAELDDYASRVASWAIAEGLRRGDVVALLMANRPEYVAIWLGLSRIGVITALLNTNLTGDRLAHCVREANTRHWIVGEELLDAAESALAELDENPRLLSVAGRGEAGADFSSSHAWESFDDVHAASSNGPVPDSIRAERKGEDGLFLIYTSGTTGLPKAARVSHTKAISAGAAAWKLQGLTPNDRVYICLPLYHSAGGMMAVGAGLLAGGSLVIAKRFSAKRFWSDCAQHDVTSIQYIGELCRYLLNSPTHPDERGHKVRVVLGNGLRPEIWEAFQERFAIPRIVEFYGATEGNMPLFNIPGRVGAIGFLPKFVRRLLGIEVARFNVDTEELVRDEAGSCVVAGPDEPGELLIRITKTARFEGYTNDDASNKKVLRDGFGDGHDYFRTGDLLRLDEDGFYFFVDRIGDTFRWKGENVATSEVAEVVSVVPGVEEANIYGVEIVGTDGRAGMAALVTTDEFDGEILSERVNSELAFYARPVFVRLLPQMEITGTFKHRKVDLVKEGFDPARISDPLFFLDAEKGRYVPLSVGLYDEIVSGQRRV